MKGQKCIQEVGNSQNEAFHWHLLCVFYKFQIFWPVCRTYSMRSVKQTRSSAPVSLMRDSYNNTTVNSVSRSRWARLFCLGDSGACSRPSADANRREWQSLSNRVFVPPPPSLLFYSTEQNLIHCSLKGGTAETSDPCPLPLRHHNARNYVYLSGEVTPNSSPNCSPGLPRSPRTENCHTLVLLFKCTVHSKCG